MPSTVDWWGPMPYRCPKCGEVFDTKVYTRLPECPEHPERKRPGFPGPPILMFPATLAAMKAWMTMAHRELAFRERIDRLHRDQLKVALRCTKQLSIGDFCRNRYDVVYIAGGDAYCRVCAGIAGIPESEWIQLNG